MNKSMFDRIEETVIDGWFKEPPPLIAVMSSVPTVGATRAFVLQWTKFSRLFPRWVGSIMSNCPDFAVLSYEVQNLMSEVVRDPAGDDNHYHLLVRLGESVGLTLDEIESFPVLDEASEVFDWLWKKARDPDWLIGFTAVNGLEILGDHDLPTKYGISVGTGLAPGPYAESLNLDHDSLEFFEVSDEADTGHGQATIEIIARHTPAGREDEILDLLKEAMTRLRRMMDATWKLAEEIDAKQKVKADGQG